MDTAMINARVAVDRFECAEKERAVNDAKKREAEAINQRLRAKQRLKNRANLVMAAARFGGSPLAAKLTATHNGTSPLQAEVEAVKLRLAEVERQEARVEGTPLHSVAARDPGPSAARPPPRERDRHVDEPAAQPAAWRWSGIIMVIAYCELLLWEWWYGRIAIPVMVPP